MTTSKNKIVQKNPVFTSDVYFKLIQSVANEVFKKYLETKEWEEKKMKIYIQQFDEVKGEVSELKQVCIEMQAKFDSVLHQGLPEIIVVEQMEKKDVKSKVLEYMKKHKSSDIEVLHKNIRCDIGILIQIVNELVDEGKIKG